MKYRCIQECAEEYPIRMMVRLLQVSSSGYYAWRKCRQSPRSQENERLVRLIREIHRESDGTYGSPRMLIELRMRGHHVGHNRVARLMRRARLRGSMKKRYRIMSGRRSVGPVAENVLDRQFTPSHPNQAWAADITYIRTDEGWLYLAVVIDLFSRRVVGWSMQDRIGRDLVMNAVTMAIWQRQPQPGLLHHSDRGSQYVSEDFQRLLSEHGIRCSMSAHGNCYDNACVESFFATLKRERVYRRHYSSRQEARADLFEYIEVFYNRRRRHSLLGDLSPADYESGLNNPN